MDTYSNGTQVTGILVLRVLRRHYNIGNWGNLFFQVLKPQKWLKTVKNEVKPMKLGDSETGDRRENGYRLLLFKDSKGALS